jgi:hypothetical protein
MKQNAAAAANFVPFDPPPAAAPPPDAGPRLKVVPRPEGHPHFSPLPEPGSGAGAGVHPTSPLAAHPPRTPAAAPAITLERDGDRVTAIRIECSCGQVIEVSCSY